MCIVTRVVKKILSLETERINNKKFSLRKIIKSKHYLRGRENQYATIRIKIQQVDCDIDRTIET